MEEPEPVGGGEGFSIVSVINEGIAGFLAVSAGLIIILVSLIPLIVLGIVAYAIYRWWRKRKGEKQTMPEERKKEKSPPLQ
jgi:flagellar basal body-associated protein FliL